MMQVLELPYEGDDISMLVFLPKGGISEVEAVLTGEKISQVRLGLHELELPISIPKFKLSTFAQLTRQPKAIGRF
jgi:serpin B